MKFNQIYFFEHSAPGDKSKYKKEFLVTDIQAIIIEKSGFTLKFQLIDKFYILHFKYHWEVIMWLDGI